MKVADADGNGKLEKKEIIDFFAKIDEIDHSEDFLNSIFMQI